MPPARRDGRETAVRFPVELPIQLIHQILVQAAFDDSDFNAVATAALHHAFKGSRIKATESPPRLRQVRYGQSRRRHALYFQPDDLQRIQLAARESGKSATEIIIDALEAIFGQIIVKGLDRAQVDEAALAWRKANL